MKPPRMCSACGVVEIDLHVEVCALCCTPTEADEETARLLIESGFRQTSAAYRHVARLPEGKTAFDALADVDPRMAKAFLDRVEDHCRDFFLRVHAARDPMLHKTLTIAEFKAFKKQGGPVA